MSVLKIRSFLFSVHVPQNIDVDDGDDGEPDEEDARRNPAHFVPDQKLFPRSRCGTDGAVADD